MTAPLPSPVLSPIAGLANALKRLTISRLRDRIAELNTALDDAWNRNHELRDAACFADSDAAGYIDRTGLDA